MSRVYTQHMPETNCTDCSKFQVILTKDGFSLFVCCGNVFTDFKLFYYFKLLMTVLFP